MAHLFRLTTWLTLALLLCAGAPRAAEPTPTQLFDWAEGAYPGFFPGHEANRSAAPYVYRYYPSTGNHVGVANQEVYVLGPVSGGQLLHVGALGDFTCRVLPSQCVAKAAESLAARLAPALGYTLAVDPSGRLLTWGAYLIGATTQTVPGSSNLAIRGLPAIKGSFADGSGGGLALTTDGVVYSWGFRGADGQPVGTAPKLVAGLSDVIDLAACTNSRFALKRDGTLWQWNESSSAAPWMLEGQTGFEALSETTVSDGCQVHAIQAGGKVWRVTGKVDSQAATLWDPVPGLPPVKQVACGSVHCLAVSQAGEVWAWGNNDWGQLGDGSVISAILPVKVSGLTGIRKAAAGYRSSYALSSSGQVYRWGRHGVLVRIGRITDTTEMAPVPVPGSPTDVVDIYARVHASWGGLYLVRRNGAVLGWGPNTGGEVDAPRQTYVDVVTPVASINLGVSE